MVNESKRLFFGVDVHAPWPQRLPKGRILDPTHRHLTLAFLGDILFTPLQKVLDGIPKLTSSVGLCGFFDRCIFLPPRHPHVAAWNVQFWDKQNSLAGDQQCLSKWLKSNGFVEDERSWLPHVTLCREPFIEHEWKQEFARLPFYTGSLNLYESVGNLIYKPIWSAEILPPFEEIDHTADLGFIIRGETIQQLYHNAFTALSFKFPNLVDFFISGDQFNHIEDLIMTLNKSVAQADCILGCPFKAVSFHGEILKISDARLQWEMIVDV